MSVFLNPRVECRELEAEHEENGLQCSAEPKTPSTDSRIKDSTYDSVYEQQSQ